MAVLVICGVNEEGRREILAIEPMAEESEASYTEVFRKLKIRGMGMPRLVISDAHTGLVSYEKKYPKATKCLEDGLEDTLSYYAFPLIEAKKIQRNTQENQGSGDIP